MLHTETVKQAVIERLTRVIDPETGVDVMRMRLVQDLSVDEAGKVTYLFRPSSPLCPIAVPLAVAIIQAVWEVEQVSSQDMRVVDYVGADQLNEILATVLEERPAGMENDQPPMKDLR